MAKRFVFSNLAIGQPFALGLASSAKLLIGTAKTPIGKIAGQGE